MNFSLIGNHNLSFLIQDIKNSFLSSNIRINLVDIPFGQGYLYIHDEKSKLYQDKIDFFVFIERLEATAHYSEMTTKEFIDCIENDNAPIVTVEDGINVLRLIDAARDSSINGDKIIL